MSTLKSKSILDQALAGIPRTFRKRLIDQYRHLKHEHAVGRYDSAGLAAGKFCEVVLRVLQELTAGSHTPFGAHIPSFADECRKIITSSGGSVPQSLRTLIPRALVFVYTMRNKRGIGHVGGDVEPNKIDAAVITTTADWIVCELIRVYHRLSLEEAQDLVDTVATRSVPNIWEVAGKKRVLRDRLTAAQQVLLLLHSEPGSFVLAEDLCNWVEYSQLSMFKRNVLRPLHKQRLIEFDEESDTVYLSPLGIEEVEHSILTRNTT